MTSESPGDPTNGAGATDTSAMTSTVELLRLARGGDAGALDALLARLGPPLRRWARGRLPHALRDITDTDDLVQETLIATMRHLDTFEYRTDAALHAYVRQAVLNRIRNEVRRASRHMRPELLHEDLPGRETSPLEAMIGHESLRAYEEAMLRLTAAERAAIIGRVELGLSYAELARNLERPSADAARMAVGRALARLGALLGTTP